MKIAFIDCFSGVSGDKLLAAMLDCTEADEQVNENLGKVVPGLSISLSEVKKNGVGAKKLEIHPPSDKAAGNWKDLLALIENSNLEQNIKEKSLAILGRMADTESNIHDLPLGDLHLHEIGGWDTIAEIVGCVTILSGLDLEMIFASHIAIGSGNIETEHGILPVPAPATIELLKNIPVYEGLKDVELTTPTGAVLISSITDRFSTGLPPMKINNTGYGAGEKDLSIPNIVRFMTGESSLSGLRKQVILKLSCNIDDMNPEFIPYVIDKLLEAGAADAWVVPVNMKKGRPGFELNALAEYEQKQNVSDIFFKETTTLGLRIAELERECIERKTVEIKVSGLSVTVKVGFLEGLAVNVAPEFEDIKHVAKVTGLPLKLIYQQAVNAATKLL